MKEQLTNFYFNKFKKEGKYVAKRFIRECIAGVNSREINVVGKPMIPSALKTSGNVTSVTPDTYNPNFHFNQSLDIPSKHGKVFVKSSLPSLTGDNNASEDDLK